MIPRGKDAQGGIQGAFVGGTFSIIRIVDVHWSPCFAL
jgi:Na+/melibiose symporter-like transporter